MQTDHRETEKAEPETKLKRLNPIKLKQMKERVVEVEEEIARLEAAISTAETALQNFVSVEETQRQTELLKRAKIELERAMNEWEELSQTLAARSRLNFSTQSFMAQPPARWRCRSCLWRSKYAYAQRVRARLQVQLTITR